MIKILRKKKKKTTGRELPYWVQVHNMWGPRIITHLLGYNPILCKEEKVLLHHKLMIGLEEKIPATPDHLLVLTQIWAGNVFWVEILSIPLRSKLCTLPVSFSGSSQKNIWKLILLRVSRETENACSHCTPHSVVFCRHLFFKWRLFQWHPDLSLLISPSSCFWVYRFKYKSKPTHSEH